MRRTSTAAAVLVLVGAIAGCTSSGRPAAPGSTASGTPTQVTGQPPVTTQSSIASQPAQRPGIGAGLVDALSQTTPLPDSPSAHGTYTLKPGAVEVPRSDVTGNLRSISPDGTTYTFARPLGQLTRVHAGTVIALDGLALRRVTSVSTTGGAFVLATAPASVGDAFSTAHVRIDGPIDFSHALVQLSSTFGPAKPAGAPSSWISPGGSDFSITYMGIEFGLSAAPQADGSLQVTVSGHKADVATVDLSATATISAGSLHAAFDVVNSSLDDVQEVVNGLISHVTFQVTAGSEDGTNIQFPAARLPLKISVPFVIGAIPVVATFDAGLSFTVGLGAKNEALSGELDADVSGDPGVSDSGGSGAAEGGYSDQLSEQPPRGAALAPVGAVYAFDWKLSLGVGVVEAQAGPYVGYTVSLGIAYSGTVAGPLVGSSGASTPPSRSAPTTGSRPRCSGSARTSRSDRWGIRRPSRGATRPAARYDPAVTATAVGAAVRSPRRREAHGDTAPVAGGHSRRLAAAARRRSADDQHGDDLTVVADCADLDQTRRAIADEVPDVVVTDVRMPPGHSDEGIQIAVELRRTHPEIGVVVLSQYAEPAYATALFTDGTARRAYLLKDRVSEPDQLANAIRSVASGGSAIDPAIVDILVSRANRKPASPLAQLTPRELEVLEQVAQGKSNAAVGAALFLSERAVEKHINALFAKLGLGVTPDVNRRVAAVLLLLSERGVPKGG